MKCKVGENPEVLLCSLVPGVQESCALDLLFDQEVTFTVSGATSVHLTGYYMPLEDPYDSEDESDYDSEEEGFEFSGDDEDISDLEGHPSSGKLSGFVSSLIREVQLIICSLYSHIVYSFSLLYPKIAIG